MYCVQVSTKDQNVFSSLYIAENGHGLISIIDRFGEIKTDMRFPVTSAYGSNL